MILTTLDDPRQRLSEHLLEVEVEVEVDVEAGEGANARRADLLRLITYSGS